MTQGVVVFQRNTVSEEKTMLHVDCFMGGECNLMWIFFTSQSTLIIDPKIMLNLEIVCDTLNIIFGVVYIHLSKFHPYHSPHSFQTKKE
jgi:hypothetical protein